MRSTFDEIAKELEDLRALVKSIAPVNSALVGHTDSLVRQYVLIRRRFDYAAFVVALYASFEKFLENLVAAYASLATRRCRYADLPPQLAKKHLSQTAEILARGRLGEGRYIGLCEYDVVKNLYECLNGDTPYTLNKAAITAHDTNLRMEEISKLFGAVGIEHACDRVRYADALKEWYRTSNSLDVAPQDGVPKPPIEEKLKDIVERRNRVAHGGNPDNLLGPEDMSDLISFVEAFSMSVYTIVVGRYLLDHHATSGQVVQLKQLVGQVAC